MRVIGVDPFSVRASIESGFAFIRARITPVDAPKWHATWIGSHPCMSWPAADQGCAANSSSTTSTDAPFELQEATEKYENE